MKKTGLFSLLRSLLLMVILFTSGIAVAQQTTSITLQMSNQPLNNVLNEIEAKSGYSILVRSTDVNLKSNVSINAVNKTVREILTQLFSNTGISYEITGKSISIFKPQVQSTDKSLKKINGTVTDNRGDAIIGATIVVNGTDKGTITDYNGKFSIEAPDNGSLNVTYIGYTPIEVKYGSKTTVNIKLSENINSLDEVIVVGYGTQKKVNLTGAVSQISSKEIENRPVSNMSQMLQGIVPNMNVTFSSGRPGQGGTFNIRGNTSINGGSPLILIDGVEGSIDRVNPRDVESVSVLKDASASAVYGARASFGVILVTTKQGTNNKTNISYGMKIGVSAPTTSTNYETRGYYSALINDAFFKSYAGQNYTKYTEADYEQLFLRKDDKTENPDRPWVVIDQRDGKDTYVYYANTDWYKYLFDDKRPSQEQSISINGGNNKVKYLLSGNMFQQKGMFRISPDNFRSFNFRSKITAEIKPWLNISNNTKYFRSDYTFPGKGAVNNTFSNMNVHGLASLVPVNPDGSFVYLTSLSNYQLMDGWSALLANDKHTNKDQTGEFSTTFEAVANVFKGFDIRANYSYTHLTSGTMNRSANIPYSKYPGEISTITTGNGLDQLNEKVVNNWYQAGNLYANYEKTFNTAHNVKLMAGGNYETKYFKDLSMWRQGLLSTELNDFNLATGEVMDISGGQNQYVILGAFFRANYDYKGKYLFETSGRSDGSSRFMSGHRFGFFPSASVAWRLSEESFFDNLRTEIPNIKIRASYGSLGNQQIVGYFDYIQLINSGGLLDYSFGDGIKPSSSSVSAPNASDLTWEIVSTKNLGIDFSLFKGRLDFTGDIYSRETKGMLVKGKDLPAAYGASSPKMNSADLRTNGWEVTTGWHDNFMAGRKKFNYNMRFVIGDYTSTITKYDNPTKLLNDYYVGQNIGDMWGYVIDGYFKTDEEALAYDVDQTSVNEIINTSAGTEQGLKAGDMKYKDLNGDKVITPARTLDDRGDQEVIGNSQPRYSYGFNMGGDWNGFDLSIFFQGIGEQNWYPSKGAISFWGPYTQPYATFIESGFLSRVWSEDNPNAYFPRPRGYMALKTNRSLGAVNNRYLQNLAYLRLKNLNVGYSLPTSLLAKVKIEKVRIYFSGENLMTFSKINSDYIDPELAATGGADGDTKRYAWSKTFSLGLDITF